MRRPCAAASSRNHAAAPGGRRPPFPARTESTSPVRAINCNCYFVELTIIGRVTATVSGRRRNRAACACKHRCVSGCHLVQRKARRTAVGMQTVQTSRQAFEGRQHIFVAEFQFGRQHAMLCPAVLCCAMLNADVNSCASSCLHFLLLTKQALATEVNGRGQ